MILGHLDFKVKKMYLLFDGILITKEWGLISDANTNRGQ
jgi:hypothetical protein